VLLKALQDRHLIDSDRGRIAVGWVIVEDIAMVLALVLIPALAGLLGGTAAETSDPFVNLFERFSGITLNIWGIIAITVVKLGAPPTSSVSASRWVPSLPA
jgi:CPA2 family monovalent cation:H+ antiporter-2